MVTTISKQDFGFFLLTGKTFVRAFNNTVPDDIQTVSVEEFITNFVRFVDDYPSHYISTFVKQYGIANTVTFLAVIYFIMSNSKGNGIDAKLSNACLEYILTLADQYSIVIEKETLLLIKYDPRMKYDYARIYNAIVAEFKVRAQEVNDLEDLLNEIK